MAILPLILNNVLIFSKPLAFTDFFGYNCPVAMKRKIIEMEK